MTEPHNKETFQFQAEVGKVLDLVIHSLYSNKEIFLRELISNASDANDKLRYAAINDSGIYGNDIDLKIRIEIDKAAHLITISDNGIGMSRDEVIEHLGTIAKSGTSEFLAKLTAEQTKDSHLIGQFGVGFYSSFIVADRVTVRSRQAGLPANQAVEWKSDGTNSYTIENIEKTNRGTDVILHIRPELTEFLSEERLKGIIKKYSDHISWPIIMACEVEKDGKKEIQDEVVNHAQALWTLPKSQITDEQYKELYRHISHDFQDPMLWIHTHVEGKQNYITLLYIPEHAPFDLWHPTQRYGLKLYAQRVFIMDDAAHFLPRYLRFVKGIVDSSDLPLNVSREILQDSKLIEIIRTSSIKKILSTLDKMAENEAEKYQKFWNEFGTVMKEGPIEDFANREALAKLMRFSSTYTNDEKQTVSLVDYVKRMKSDQKKIYYITAENFNSAKNSPHIEFFRKKDIEVLLLSDRIDDWLMMHLGEFEGKQFQSIAQGEIEESLDTEHTQEEKKQAEDEFSSIISHIKKVLGDKIKDVKLTYRLTHSPACLVADEHDIGRQMQRVLRAAGQTVPTSKPIFELNPTHPIVIRLKHETDDQRFENWINILFDQAMLAEGESLENPTLFVERLNEMLLELTK